MSRHSAILSLLLLTVYGVLTLVAVPLHHHVSSYEDSPALHASSHHVGDCAVCTFSSNSAVDAPAPVTAAPVHADDRPMAVVSDAPVSAGAVLTAPHRGPPVALS